MVRLKRQLKLQEEDKVGILSERERERDKSDESQKMVKEGAGSVYLSQAPS